jgi:hypothetical protein
MSNSVSDRLAHYQNATKEDSVIKGKIVEVSAFGSFSTGWINYDFMYEIPHILIDLRTEIGIFQLELTVDKLDYNPILSWVGGNKTDLRNLVGNSMYVAPNEKFDRACISADPQVVFNKEKSHIIRSGDNIQNVNEFKMDTDMSMSGIQKMPLDRINYILQTEIYRHFDNENGWIKTDVEMQENSEEVIFTARIKNSVDTINWSFKNGVNDYENIRSFLDKLNLGHILTESCGELWVKPIRDLHFTNRPKDTDLISDNQTWVASARPMKPEKDKPSILKKIKDLFSRGDKVEVSVGSNKTKKSEIAETYSKYEEPCYYNGDSDEQLQNRVKDICLDY